MKRIYIFITLLAVTAASCKRSFIDLSPEDQISGANLYKTEPLLRQALAGAYTPLRDLMVNDFYTGEMRSDNTHYEFYQIDRGTAYVQRENIADFTDDPTNAYTNAVYFHCYNGINRANLILENMGQAPLSDSSANDIAGQAEFIRAFNYFKLVRYFGGVPLFLKGIKNADDAFLLRATAAEVYTQIIKDAQDAINKLGGPGFSAAGKQSGQATKGAAIILLAEVYMTQKKYPEAANLLTSLDGMGYDLLTDYAAVFSPDNKNSKESIFEVQYLQGLQGNQNSDFIYRFLPRSLNTQVITNTKTNNRTLGGWNTPTADMIATYEAGDKRLDASIGMAEGTYNASNEFTFSANKSVLNYTPDAGKIGVPYIKKYLHAHANPGNTDDNWPIYRYADALLMLAEALNEQGSSAAALAPLNRVRARAFGDGAHNITTTVQTTLRDIIAHERRVELAFENHRWHDLVRTGKAIEVMTADGIRLKQQYSYLSAATYQVNENKLLFPIPQSERELNPKLTQNPGYPQ